MSLLGIDHVQIAAPAGCEAKARRFYGELLGLTELEKPQELAGRGGVWFAVGDQQLHIGVTEDFTPALKAHPALRVAPDEFDQLAARLEQAGSPVEPDVDLPGQHRFHTADPWGNRIELLAAFPIVTVSPFGPTDAEQFAQWRYEGEYSFYDSSPTDADAALKPENRYYAVRRNGELIAHVCVGPEARVAGMKAEPGVDDIGFGLRPDLTGHGEFRTLLPEIMDALVPELTAPAQRVVVAAWNDRALSAARHAGFDATGSVVNNLGRWIVLTRQERRQGTDRRA
ncbi:MAG TPA: VOC family protein [Solirubrobacteraceae bacterium]|nr:VOC family protein [Solirubrobacteraceae bacterium]